MQHFDFVVDIKNVDDVLFAFENCAKLRVKKIRFEISCWIEDKVIGTI